MSLLKTFKQVLRFFRRISYDVFLLNKKLQMQTKAWVPACGDSHSSLNGGAGVGDVSPQQVLALKSPCPHSLGAPLTTNAAFGSNFL